MLGISWSTIIKVFIYLTGLIVILSSIFFFLLGVIDLAWTFIIISLTIAILSTSFIFMPKAVELKKLGLLSGRDDSTSLISPALRDKLELVREKHNALEIMANAEGLWKILRDQIKDAYMWDLKHYTPTTMRIYSKPEHQYFVAMLDRDRTGHHRNIVEMLNLRAIDHKDEIAWWNSIPVTDFKEFQRMMEAGEFDREKREKTYIPIDKVTADIKI